MDLGERKWGEALGGREGGETAVRTGGEGIEEGTGKNGERRNCIQDVMHERKKFLK